MSVLYHSVSSNVNPFLARFCSVCIAIQNFNLHFKFILTKYQASVTGVDVILPFFALILFLLYKAASSSNKNTIICCWCTIATILFIPAFMCIALMIGTYGVMKGMGLGVACVGAGIIILLLFQGLLKAIMRALKD